jgi:putative sugar O-methyltransferase
MTNDIDLLDLMTKKMMDQKDFYKPGEYWLHKIKSSTKKMSGYDINQFRSNMSGTVGLSYTDSEVIDPSLIWDGGKIHRRLLKKIIDTKIFRRLIIDKYMKIIHDKHDEITKYRNYLIETSLLNDHADLLEILQGSNFPKTMVGGYDNPVLIDGVEYAPIYIELLNRIKQWSAFVDFEKVETVFEIGGGFGVNAHILLSLYPNIKKYIYLDIPPNLYIGTQYLKHHFNDFVIDYRETYLNDKITFQEKIDTLEILCIAPWQIEKLTDIQVDLFCNSSSFVEMPIKVIENYYKYILNLMANKSYLCLQTYGGYDVSTLSPDELFEVFNHGFDTKTFKSEQFAAPTKPYDYYCVGKKITGEFKKLDLN